LVRKLTAVHALPTAVAGVCGPAKTITQHDLRPPETVDDGDRDLVAALPTLGEPGTSQFERNFRAQALIGNERLLRARRNAGEERENEYRSKATCHRGPTLGLRIGDILQRPESAHMIQTQSCSHRNPQPLNR